MQITNTDTHACCIGTYSPMACFEILHRLRALPGVLLVAQLVLAQLLELAPLLVVGPLGP